MRKIKSEEAIGQRLCHDLTAIEPGGQKGVRFARNHLIQAEDIPRLLEMGKRHVFVWEPDGDEVHEEEAALALARALQPQLAPHFSWLPPQEGKISLVAQTAGLFSVNEALMNQLNQIKDWLVVSLRQNQPVEAGTICATWRVLPLVTGQQQVDEAVAAVLSALQPLFTLSPYQSLEVGVIVTGNEIYEGRIQDAFGPIIRHKLLAYPNKLHQTILCPDSVEAIQEAIERHYAEGCRLILLSGGMSVDPDDVTPTAMVQAGATLLWRGLPVQPGNLLTLARYQEGWLLGVPGASIHSAVTSLDIVLPRLFSRRLPDEQERLSWAIGGLYRGQGFGVWPTLAPEQLQNQFQEAKVTRGGTAHA